MYGNSQYKKKNKDEDLRLASGNCKCVVIS